MIRRLALMAVVLGAAAPPPGASSCSGCHGPTARPPILAGRPAADTVAAFEAFRTGTKPATVMNRIAKGFTPDEVKAIAAWWAEAKP
jgi:cytochrome subunit of sulfide dehydrogenase